MAIAIAPVVALNGRGLGDRWQQALLEVRVDQALNRPWRVALRFADPGYQLLSSGDVRLGTPITVHGPDGDVALVEGEVTEVACEQSEGEQPELLVVAHDRSHRLARRSTARTFVGTGTAQVVSQLASSVGLEAAVSGDLPVLDYLLQADTDLGLLGELARRCGCDWWVEGTRLHVGPPATTSGPRLRLGDDLRSFSARAAGHRPDQVVVGGWDRDTQEAVSATAGTASGTVQARSDLAEVVDRPGAAFGSATVRSAAVGVLTEAEASQLSQALFDRQVAASVEAWGVAEGAAEIAPGRRVDVVDAGPLSGSYGLTAVEHVYRPGRGYLTRFRSGDHDPPGLGGQRGTWRDGSVVAHPELVPGIVTNINDPARRGRVKVRFPTLGPEVESTWARVVAIGGGTQRGAVFLPEVGDEVLVAFESGDTRAPVVLGGLYGSRSTIPPPSLQDGKVERRSITSRLGHVVSLVDGVAPASQAIELVLAGGEHLLHLGKDKVRVQVPAGTPVEVQAGSTSLAVNDAGQLAIRAASVSIQAEQQIQLQAPNVTVAADGALSLEGQVSTSVKGATVSVQGEGPVSISGATVAIN
jgi:uncharacterized protein involved in type VI secretion and phage assembly